MSNVTGYALTIAPSGAPAWVDPAIVALDCTDGESFVVLHPDNKSRSAETLMFFATWPLAATAFDALQAAYDREVNPWQGYVVKSTNVEERNGAAELQCVVRHLRTDEDEEIVFPLEQTTDANLGRYRRFVLACGLEGIDDSDHFHGRHFAMRIDEYGHRRFATLSAAL